MHDMRRGRLGLVFMGGGWADVWHLVLAIISRQAPFVQVMSWTGAVFFLVMAIEGIRSSILAMTRSGEATVTSAPVAEIASPPMALGPVVSQAYAAVPRVAGKPPVVTRKRKPLTTRVRHSRPPKAGDPAHPFPGPDAGVHRIASSFSKFRHTRGRCCIVPPGSGGSQHARRSWKACRPADDGRTSSGSRHP